MTTALSFLSACAFLHCPGMPSLQPKDAIPALTRNVAEQLTPRRKDATACYVNGTFYSTCPPQSWEH